MTVKRSLSIGPFLFQISEDLGMRATCDSVYRGGAIHFEEASHIEVASYAPTKRVAVEQYTRSDVVAGRRLSDREDARTKLHIAFIGIRRIVAQYQAEQFAHRED